MARQSCLGSRCFVNTRELLALARALSEWVPGVGLLFGRQRTGLPGT